MDKTYQRTPEALERLTPRQRAVTQDDVTEPPFDNEFWDSKEPGIYVDVVSGEPLFASVHKFDSRTGWPSFTIPLEPENVVELPRIRSESPAFDLHHPEIAAIGIGEAVRPGAAAPPPERKRWSSSPSGHSG
jgi:hypothetical protein